MAKRIAEPVPTSPVATPEAAENLCTVVSNDPVNSDYVHMVLDAPHPATDVVAGQFFHLLCPSTDTDQPFFRRPMSVYWIDRDAGRIEFLYKVQGPGTRGLASLEPGGTLNALGPLGEGFNLDPAWKGIVVVGRGVGLATLAPLARMAGETGVPVTAILSARRPDLLMSVDLFRREGAEVITVTDSDGSSGPATVERHLRGLIDRGRADAFFTCGSNRLLRLLQWLGQEHGIVGQVAMEQQMACGLGMCFCCVRDFRVDGKIVHRRVCWEGPVFDLHEAISW